MEVIESQIGRCKYVNDQDSLEDLVRELREVKELVGIDTESYPLVDIYGSKASALDPHTSACRLISIYWLSTSLPYVVDVRGLDLDSFKEQLLRGDIEKVSHYATHDMKVLRSLLGVWIPSWRCSSIAMATLGVSNGWKSSSLRGHKLKDLARDYFSIHLAKELGRSDWSGALSDEQIIYSAIDVASPLGSSTKSVIIEGYQLFKQTSIDIGQEWSFNLDQEVVPILSRAEYTGLPVSKNVLSCIGEQSLSLVEEKKLDLCKKLSIPVQESIGVDEEGNFRLEIVIPEWASTLLNNNKGLVKYMDKVLRTTTGMGLSNLKAETLEATLKAIEGMDEEEIVSADLDLGIDLINQLLSYKRLAKLATEASKYLEVLNPITGCIHTTTRCIGTSTGRMSSSGDKEAATRVVNSQQISTVPIKITTDKDLYKTDSKILG
jgi:DNA polymerase I-like protein with 3'-5' exonuclease and polymerase domains